MGLIWSVTDLVDIAKKRQQNKYDVIIAVSGLRGTGKSSLSAKFFFRFDGFKPWKHQVYTRKEVMTLLESQKYGFIFDDEAIRTSYKRNFYEQDQKLLIQMLNMYRDNFNIYVLCVPTFYSLDKDLRNLISIHLHVVKRGLAIVHLPKEGVLYSDDPWDINYNAKVENRWNKLMMKKPNFSPPYHKLTTFRGYLKFHDLTQNQRELYERIKVGKRKEVYLKEMNQGEEDEKTTEELFYKNLYDRLKLGYLNQNIIQELCMVNGKKYSSVLSKLNTMLHNEGIKDSCLKFFDMSKKVFLSSTGSIKAKIAVHNNHQIQKNRFNFIDE